MAIKVHTKTISPAMAKSMLETSYSLGVTNRKVSNRHVEIYAEEIGTKRAEFYAGLAAGLKPEKTLRIFAFEYENEKIAEIDGVRYQITRTYPVDDERLELILTDIAEAG